MPTQKAKTKPDKNEEFLHHAQEFIQETKEKKKEREQRLKECENLSSADLFNNIIGD